MHTKRLIALLIAAVTAVYFTLPVYPQLPQADVDKATRETDRPVRKEAEEKLKVPPRKPPEIEEKEEEKKPEDVQFFVEKIHLIGTESFSPDEFKEVIEPYENRDVSFAELSILAKRIEREYLKKGIIAACFVPPQDVKDRAVTLRVVEARMGELKVEDHRYFSNGRIRYYWEPRPDEILRYDEISRSLQFINKNPDRKAKATLRAGKKPGTTDVSINADTQYPLHTNFSLDREGAASTGNWRKKAGFRHNNFFGFDDTLLAGWMGGEHFWGVYGFHVLPITGFGTSLLYGYSYTKTNPRGDFTRYDVDARTKNASFFLYQDLYKKDKYLGDVYCGLDAKDKRIEMTTGVVNRDRLRIIRAGGNFVHRELGSTTYVRPEVSQGVDFLWARDRDHLSTRNGNNVFTKLNIGVEHSKALPFDLQLNLKFDGQLVFTKMTTQEEFYLGGIKSVRGYPAGDFLADNALEVNTELLYPAFFIPKEVKLPYAARPLKEDITGLVFFDYGCGKRRGRDVWTERRLAHLASFGAGLRIRLFDQALLRLEWGFPIGDKTTSGSNDVRLHLSLDFEDKIPQEIERINKILKTK